MTDLSHIYVNGRFLGRGVTGVERFAAMTLREMDAALQHDGATGHRWTLLVPQGVARPDWWHQGFETVGHRGGHVWEQWDLARRARDGVLLNLCNSGPVTLARQLTIVHDALVYDLPQNFRPAYRLLHRTLGRLIARRSRIGTVSAFSRDRLSTVLKLDPEMIPVVPNAADHVATISPDDGIIARLGLADTPFLLFVGSFAPNKNLPVALRAFERLAKSWPDPKLVLVGASGKLFAASGFDDVPPGVILPGRIGDGELMALYRHARALIFPSSYEGFGIPPLEALQLGCPVIASDIPPTREVCGDAAHYVPEGDANALAAAMRTALADADLRQTIADKARRRAASFSWARSAALLRANAEALATASPARTAR